MPGDDLGLDFFEQTRSYLAAAHRTSVVNDKHSAYPGSALELSSSVM